MVLNQPNLERTLQLVIPKEGLNQLYEMIEDHLPQLFYSKPNSKYDTKSITGYLLMICAENASHEGISQLMQDHLA